MTTKAYIQDMECEKTKTAFALFCEKLGTDYHGLLRAMEERYKANRICTDSISNFPQEWIVDICNKVDIISTVNQIAIHTFYQYDE